MVKRVELPEDINSQEHGSVNAFQILLFSEAIDCKFLLTCPISPDCGLRPIVGMSWETYTVDISDRTRPQLYDIKGVTKCCLEMDNACLEFGTHCYVITSAIHYGEAALPSP